MHNEIVSFHDLKAMWDILGISPAVHHDIDVTIRSEFTYNKYVTGEGSRWPWPMWIHDEGQRNRTEVAVLASVERWR